MIWIIKALVSFVGYRFIRVPFVRLFQRLAIAYREKNTKRMLKLILHKSAGYNDLIALAPRNLNKRFKRGFKLSYARTARDLQYVEAKALFKSLQRVHFSLINQNLIPKKWWGSKLRKKRQRTKSYSQTFFSKGKISDWNNPFVDAIISELGLEPDAVAIRYKKMVSELLRRQKSPYSESPRPSKPSLPVVQEQLVKKVKRLIDCGWDGTVNPYDPQQLKSSWIESGFWRGAKKSKNPLGVLFLKLIITNKIYAFSGVYRSTFEKMLTAPSPGKVAWTDFLREHFERWGFPREIQRGTQGKIARISQWDYSYQSWFSHTPKSYQKRAQYLKSSYGKRQSNWNQRAKKYTNIPGYLPFQFGENRKLYYAKKTPYRSIATYRRLVKTHKQKERYFVKKKGAQKLTGFYK